MHMCITAYAHTWRQEQCAYAVIHMCMDYGYICAVNAHSCGNVPITAALLSPHPKLWPTVSTPEPKFVVRLLCLQ